MKKGRISTSAPRQATPIGPDLTELRKRCTLSRHRKCRWISYTLAKLEERGCPFVIVIGHSDCYPRFGFERVSRYGIRCKWEVPDEALMILILDTFATEGVFGAAHFRSEFG